MPYLFALQFWFGHSYTNRKSRDGALRLTKLNSFALYLQHKRTCQERLLAPLQFYFKYFKNNGSNNRVKMPASATIATVAELMPHNFLKALQRLRWQQILAILKKLFHR
jgi:hypothetical protein